MTLFLVCYFWAGVCLYLSHRPELNRSFDGGQHFVIALCTLALWPLYPVLFLFGD